MGNPARFGRHILQHIGCDEVGQGAGAILLQTAANPVEQSMPIGAIQTIERIKRSIDDLS
jgi:hypothetical protein